MDNPSNTNIHTIVKAQIVFLLSTLTEDNFERNQVEIRSLSEQHGIDSYLHFIRRLIVHSQARLLSSTPSAPFDASSALTFRLLIEETQRLARDPYLADRFRDGIDKGEGDIFRHFDLVRFCDRVGLRPLERFVLTAAVASATRKDLSSQAVHVIHVEFENAVLALCRNPSFEHADLSASQISKLMNNLLCDASSESPYLDISQCQALIVAVQTKLGKETASPILRRTFANLTLPAGTSLVQILVQLGTEITSDTDLVSALLERYGMTDAKPPRDAQVIDMMTALSRLAVEGKALCDVGSLVRALCRFHVKLNWSNIIKTFDWPDRQGVDTATLKLLIAILLNSPRDAEPHAVTGFWQPWSNSLYQLRLLDALLSLPADTFNFVQLPGHRIVTVDDVSVASSTIKALAVNVQGYTWNSLELFQVLVRSADSESLEVRNCVREMLDKAVKISPEIVQMGLLQVPDANWNDIRLEYSRKLLSMFLAGHSNHQLVFMRIWQIEQSYLTDAFRDFYEENSLNITRILDVAQDLKILESLLEVRPFTFALDIAALSSRREYLNLDKWLADHVAAHGVEFLRALIHFVEQKMDSEKASRVSDPAVDLRTMSLNPNTITIILRILRSNFPLLTEVDVATCMEVRNACLQLHPRLMSLVPGSDVEPGLSVVGYSNEIESEVDGIYKQMYDEHTSIDEVIALLRRHKESTNPRDHEVFACMIHFLFDEYKFFQSYYPARELAMTGYLFGSLIRHQLIDYIPLGIAIRYVLDALNCSRDTNLFKFGLQALSRFEFRIKEWRPLCEALLTIPHLAEMRPDLIASIQRASASPAPGSVPPHLQGLSPYQNEPVTVFSAVQPDEIDGEIESPPEDISDRILFIVNNLAPSNFDSKLVEMREQFADEYSRWFANYLVDQRISTEPNNHSLYLRFLDALDRQKLSKLILQETYVKAATMLNSEKTIQSGADRSVLKNVGSWLGAITLARDLPIKHKNASLKDLLLEGYDNGRLVVAIPFVCKALEPCAKSKIFRPPNPWLMAIINVLAELYHFAELKLNMKFEIEVLCGTLNINLDSVEATTILRNRPMDLLDYPPEPPSIDALPISGATQLTRTINDSQMLVIGAQSATDPQRPIGAHFESILSTLAHHIQINSQLAPLSTNQTFKRAVQIATDRAVREIILPVVERSVTIAGISTRELVSKDFATEPNEDKLRKAAHLMAQKLAGSLALVTCKEPLRSNLTTHIRQNILDHGFSELMVPEHVVAMIVQDNIDLACTAIEKAAMERAVIDVDEGFASSYEVRRRHRESRSGQAFWDPSTPPLDLRFNLPDPLRIKPNGVQLVQAEVYEDFSIDFKRRLTSRPGSASSLSQITYYNPAPLLEQRVSSHQEAMERFSVLTRDLDAVMAQLPLQSLVSLPANHDIRHLVRQIIFLAAEAGDRQRTPLMMSQKIVQLLYKTPSQLGREVYVTLLNQLCRSYEEVAKEAITWLLYAEDERKLNVAVTVTLLKSGLLSIPLQDQQLAKVIFMDPRPSLLNYAAVVIRECLSAEPPIASQEQFAYTIDVLGQLSQTGKSNEQVNQLLEDLRRARNLSLPLSDGTTHPSVPPEMEQLREKLFFWFQQWVHIYQRSQSPEKSFVSFITQLTKQGILKVEDLSSFFFRVCAESSVAHYLKWSSAGDYGLAFQALDAMSRLIVLIIKYHGDASGVNNDQAKVHYLTKILSIFVLVLANLHEEQNASFQQKPFFRFFSSLVNDLNDIELHLGSAYFQLMIAISDTYSSLQPTYFPGFAFSWMSLISHRLFMPKLLMFENREGWSAFHKLLLSLFKFLTPFLRDGDLQDASRELYQGTLRLLLVLLHDFPEFLSEYYFSLCDVIPPRCIQMRNIVLSAFPSALILPDPHLRNLKYDTIPEMGPIPPVLSDFTSGLMSGDLRSYLDQYLLNRGTPSFLSSLKDRLRLSRAIDSSADVYNLSLINSLVMYVGVSSVAQAKARSGSSLFNAADPGVVAIQYICNTLDVEGQHHLLSSIVLHLRYPNAHTHWFSALLLHLFVEVADDRFREVMTKVLLERFIVHRPHPWGALVTFIELLRNPKYDFWSKSFIQIAPEVTLLLQSVARSIFSN